MGIRGQEGGTFRILAIPAKILGVGKEIPTISGVLDRGHFLGAKTVDPGPNSEAFRRFVPDLLVWVIPPAP